MIAYLTSQYPALSHTFIRREINALRDAEIKIAPYSVRPATIDWGERVPAILGQSKARLLASILKEALAHPLKTFATWLLSQKHRETGVKGWVWSFFHCAEALALASLLRRSNATRLHSHFANSGATIGLLAAHQLDIPWSLTLHGISETDHPAGQMLPDKLRRAEFVACASWFMRAQAMRVTDPDQWSKFHIVHCGVEIPDRRGDCKPSEVVKHFVTVGRVSAEKGFPLLVRAVASMVEAGFQIKVSVVGDGPLMPELRRDIADKGLEENIVLLGALPEHETLSAIAKADAFVLPSLMEGLPVVIMEAMAAAKPVIAPTVAGIPELVKDDKTGLTFNPGSWRDLERQMRRLMEEPNLASRLADEAYEAVSRKHAIDVAVTPLVERFVSEQRISDQRL